MARPLKPLVRGGGYYPSRKWTPLVYNGGFTTMNGGEPPEPPAPFYWKTVTGVSPLALANALAENISSLTQYGKCTQASTPTPDAPVDIVCNNGALRYGALGRNLLDPSAANTVLGYYINKADGAVKDSLYNFMFAGYMPVEAGKTYVAYGRAKSGNDLSDYNRVVWYDSNKDWISGADYTQSRIAVVTAPANAAYARFSCNPSGGTSVAVTQEIVDSYNWTFCEGTAEITPFVPFVGGIYADGTPEVLTVSGANLLDPSPVTDENKYIHSQNGSPTSPSATGVVFRYSGFIPVKEGTKYFFGMTPYTAAAAGLAWYTDTTAASYISGVSGSTLRNVNNMKATAPAGAKYLRCCWQIDKGYDTDWQHSVYVCACDSNSDPIMTAWQAYVTPQTVTGIPMLLSVGDTKDEVEIISGGVTRKVGIKVLDGTEGWATTSVTSVSRAPGLVSDASTSNSSICASTHFVGATHGTTSANVPDNGVRAGYGTAAQKGDLYIKSASYPTGETLAAYLAAQYAAGTPVIVIYPLAEETAEQTTPHSLHTAQGTNVVTAVTNVDPVTLEVEYAPSEE